MAICSVVFVVKVVAKVAPLVVEIVHWHISYQIKVCTYFKHKDTNTFYCRICEPLRRTEQFAQKLFN